VNTWSAALTPHRYPFLLTGALLLAHGVLATKYHLEFQEAVDHEKYFGEIKTIDGILAM